MKNNGTQLYRICQLEKSYEALDTKIDKILTNDLPHLKQSMTNLETKVGDLENRINSFVKIILSINVAAILITAALTRLV